MNTETFRDKILWWKRFTLWVSCVVFPLVSLALMVTVFRHDRLLVATGVSRWLDVALSSLMFAVPFGAVAFSVAEVRTSYLWVVYVQSVTNGEFPRDWIGLLNDHMVQVKTRDSFQEFIGEMFRQNPSFLVYEADFDRLLMPHRSRTISEFVIRDEGEFMANVLRRLRAAKVGPTNDAVHPGTTYIIRDPCKVLA